MTETLSIEVFENQGYVLVTFYDGYNIIKSMPTTDGKLLDILESTDKPLAFVLVMDGKYEFSFDDLIVAVNSSARTGSQWLNHEYMQVLIMVGASNIVRMIAKGMQSSVFGNIQTYSCNTVDEALQYVQNLNNGTG